LRDKGQEFFDRLGRAPVCHRVLIGFVQGVRHHFGQRIAEPGIVSVQEAEGRRDRRLRAAGLPDEGRLPEVTGLGRFHVIPDF